MKFHVYLAEQPAGAVDHDPGYLACLGMCQQLGAPLPRRPVESGGASYLGNDQLRYGQVDTRELDQGDVLVLADLRPLGALVMVPMLKDLARRGVTVYCTQLGHQPVLSHLNVIEATVACFFPLVHENNRLSKENDETAERWREIYNDTVRNELVRAVQAAVPALVSAMPILGEVTPEGTTPAHIGEVIRYERERQGITSTQLGQMINVSQTSVTRLELGEYASDDVRDKALQALFLDRAKTVADRHRVAQIIEANGGGATPVHKLIS